MSAMTDVVDATDKPADFSKRVFIARVMSALDPAECHRVKVMIPDMIEGPVESLPWAIPDSISGGVGPNECKQWIPEEGSLVYVRLQDGDVNFPMYGGGVPNYESLRGVLSVNYPHRVGFEINSYTEKGSGDERKVKFDSKDDPTPYPEKGHHWFIDRSTNEFEYKHAQGTKVNVASNGKVKLTIDNVSGPPADLEIDVVKGNLIVHVKGNANVAVEGNAAVDVKGNMAATIGGTTDVNSGGALTVTAPQGTFNMQSTFNGNMAVNGNQNVTGNIATGGNITSAGVITDSNGDGGA